MRERTLHEPIERRYYARFRDIPLWNDTSNDVSALTTRYYHEIASRPCLGPRGGKNHSQLFYRDAYYYDGRFWKIVNQEVADYTDCWDYLELDCDSRDIDSRVYTNALYPITGAIHDKVPLQSMEKGIPVVCITCEDGYPVSVREGQNVIWDGDSPWIDIAHILGLDKKKRKSPKAA